VKTPFSLAVACGSALALISSCAVTWLVWSTHIPAHYPPAALAPIAAGLAAYVVVVVPSLRRSAVPRAILLSVVFLCALLTLLAGAVLNEMILCHYDRYACINL
jgi:hypothetical protein